MVRREVFSNRGRYSPGVKKSLWWLQNQNLSMTHPQDLLTDIPAIAWTFSKYMCYFSLFLLPQARFHLKSLKEQHSLLHLSKGDVFVLLLALRNINLRPLCSLATSDKQTFNEFGAFSERILKN